MAVKYVKDFQFDKSFGYTGSAGAQAGAKMGPGPVSHADARRAAQAIANANKGAQAGAKMGPGPVSNSDARRAAQAIANANKGTQTEGDVIRDRTHRIVDDTEPSASETAKMRQAREYMREDKATSDAAKEQMGFKKGGKVVEKATGERYPSKSAMMKHEKTETPRMQREEMIQKRVVRGPAMAAGRDPRIPMLMCGGKVKK